MRIAKSEEILLELLRVGLISIRNLAFAKASSEKELMLQEWSSLCHSIPPILLGGATDEPVKYFLNAQAPVFIKNYPCLEDADFKQAIGLLEELRQAMR